MDDVLKSWAVPKGPSLDPKVKHLAMMVEDRPFDYLNFERIIPKDEYGGGTVIVWDEGTYEPIEPIKGKKAQEKHLLKQLASGQLEIKLHGEKLNGEFAMVKTQGMGENNWLMGFKATMASPISENVNGFNLSPAGTICDCVVNGVSAGAIGQINRQVSGVSVSVIMNFAERHNGIQLSMFNESFAVNGFQIGVSNSSIRARGIQIGIFNSSRNLKGIQLGL